MDWFKFYGKDWLTDVKIINMPVEDRLCYLTLLCLASASEEQGIIKNCDEISIIKLTQLYDNPLNTDNEYRRAIGFLQRLSDNKMITLDNKRNIIVNAFLRRQSTNLSGYERVKKYREKQKTLNNKGLSNNDNNDNVNDNTVITLEKKRKEKKRKDINTISENTDNFEKFWEAYPKKELKKETREIWSKKKLDSKVTEILTFIERAKGTDRWKKNYIKQPTAFLNGECWTDDIASYSGISKLDVYKNTNSESMVEKLKAKTLR